MTQDEAITQVEQAAYDRAHYPGELLRAICICLTILLRRADYRPRLRS